jgi:uncharacterized protein (TIGR03437 family)
LTSQAAEFHFTDAIIRLRWLGANRGPVVTGYDQLASKNSYFLGNQPAKWRATVPNYGKVVYRGLYPGINLVFYGCEDRLEYDWLIAPGGDPQAIRLRFEGAEGIHWQANGDVVLETRGVRMRQFAPVAYQNTKKATRHVGGGYKRMGSRDLGFELSTYDRTAPLIIDPVLTFSTFLGGSGLSGPEPRLDSPGAIAMDGTGNVYITGTTYSADFPTVAPLQGTKRGFSDVFVTKLSPNGSPVYSTYLGSSGSDSGTGIAVDGSGAVYVTGVAGSDFPTVNPIQPPPARGGLFVAKMNPSGSALVYSTFLGADELSRSAGIAVDPAGRVYITGSTSSTNFPAKDAIQPAYRGGPSDAFVAALSAPGSGLLYATYLGGSARDEARGIAVDAAGNAYVTGATDSPDFVTTPGALLPKFVGPRDVFPADAFVAVLSPAGSTLRYATYLGGPGPDQANAITLDPAGNVFAVGNSDRGFPTTGPGTLPCDQAFNSFLVKFAAADLRLLYSTCTPGGGLAVAADREGNVYTTGSLGAGLALVNPVQAIKDGGICRESGPGCSDAVLVKVSAGTPNIVYSTYLGGPGHDRGVGVAMDRLGNAYVLGSSTLDFPLVRPIPGQGGRIFLAKVDSKGVMPAPGAIGNGASFVPGLITPGGVATIFGFALADVSGVLQAERYPLPTEIAGTSVTVAGVRAPLYAVADVGGVHQINFQVPYETRSGPILVTNKWGASLPVSALFLELPGVFTVDGINGAIQHASDFALVTAANPAARGEVVVIYATGLGAVDPPVPTGSQAPLSPLSRTVVTPMVTIGGMSADVLFSGLTPGYAGLYQINVRIPEDVLAGEVDVVVSIRPAPDISPRPSRPVKLAVGPQSARVHGEP